MGDEVRIGRIETTKISVGYELRLTAAMFVTSYIWMSAANRSAPIAERIHGWDFFWSVVAGWFAQWMFVLAFGVVATMASRFFTGQDIDLTKDPLKAQFLAVVAAFFFTALYWCRAYGVFAGFFSD